MMPSAEPPRRAPVNDNGPADPAAAGPLPAIGGVVGALQFFSRLPIRAPHGRPDLDAMAKVLPAASLLIGIGPAALLVIAIFVHLPGLYAAGLAVTAMVAVTGGLAEDALADAADGLFGGTTAEARLVIMKDSRHGTYGVVAIAITLLMKVGALAGMAESNTLAAAGTWLGASVLARSAALWLPASLPAARASGASASAGRVAPLCFATGGVLALLVGGGLGLVSAGLPALIAGLVVSLGLMAGWRWACRRLVGGQTGDLIGALQALIELALIGCFSIAFF